jgi:predicted metal-dependent HD superfamily phosphohydrolase
MDYTGASEYILKRLRLELNPTLCYHCYEHTIDVLEATRRLNIEENVSAGDRILLETAALYHDAGMLTQYSNHEAVSVRISREVLPSFDYTKKEIDLIADLIMVTKLPQRANNHLEQIICDADLDYLGRSDFYINSFKLRLEWQDNGIRKTTLKEWFDIQIKFLSEHRYFTKTAFDLRNETKLKNLEEIKQFYRV